MPKYVTKMKCFNGNVFRKVRIILTLKFKNQHFVPLTQIVGKCKKELLRQERVI